jgi:hypothetical protein
MKGSRGLQFEFGILLAFTIFALVVPILSWLFER